MYQGIPTQGLQDLGLPVPRLAPTEVCGMCPQGDTHPIVTLSGQSDIFSWPLTPNASVEGAPVFLELMSLEPHNPHGRKRKMMFHNLPSGLYICAVASHIIP